jgi:hypothetical protein
VPASRNNARTSYTQRRSEAQAELEQQTGIDQDLPLVHSQWTLEFDAVQFSPSSHDLSQFSKQSPTPRSGGWILSNANLRGTLWTDREQLAYRPPLGTETMWKW